MQNAGQYVPGTASTHPPQQFVSSEQSPNGGSTTSSLRQFRKRDVDKTQLEQPPKQESHVARVAPHNHYPPVSNDFYRYPPHQFPDYSPQVKYSDIAEASQPNPISTSVIQKPKPKDYMEMCNVQQQHINNQQQYSPDNGQYMHRDSTQGYPTGFKPESHYLPKDQHQYQQLAHHNGQPKFNPMMTQNMRKYNPSPADNPFLNKLSKIHPSMARSIISDHHLQDPQPSYSPMDQRTMYGQQNHRYYPSSLPQPNPYAPNPNYSMTPPHHYSNYPSASCSYPRTPTIPQRYGHMERSISPTRRGYPENMHMNPLAYHNMAQKMPATHNYSPQYAGAPEYSQHYQHRRQDCYPQSYRPAQYMQSHHQLPAQEMPELPENRISPSDSLKKFIENFAADEEPANEMNAMESSMNLRDNIKVRDDAPPGTVYMINATDMQYFESNGIPIVTSDNGGLQLTSENYQYLIKNGLVDNGGMVRIIEANKEISIDSSGNHERVVNLQIMETSKSDCMMVNRSLRPNDGSMGPNGMLSKPDDDTRRVVIHQNTVINPGNCTVSERISGQHSLSHASLHDTMNESISISKELVDKNCSPINLDQLDHNLGFSEPDPPETENNKNNDSTVPISALDSKIAGSGNTSNPKPNEIGLTEDLSQHSDDSQNKSPGSKSMPIIDLFGDSQLDATHESSNLTNADSLTSNKTDRILTDQNSEKPNEKFASLISNDASSQENLGDSTKERDAVGRDTEEEFKNKDEISKDSPLDPETFARNSTTCKISLESTSLASSVIVSPEHKKKDTALKEETKCLANDDGSAHLNEQLSSYEATDQEVHVHDISTVESLNNDERKQETVLERSPKHAENEKTELISENKNSENVATPLNSATTLAYTPDATVERRKRIFSVDDIIHHIGNNMKRGSRELVVFCSTDLLTTFLEKEIELSSLEQMLNINFLKKTPSIHEKEPLSLNFLDTNATVMLEERKENDVCNQQTSILETKEDNQETEMEPETKQKVNDSEVVCNKESLNEQLESERKQVINDEELANKITDEEMKSAEDSIQTSPRPASVPVISEHEERSNTPSAFQYRNAIRIEETSVLIQIAGELVEISVNIVNGKKVITVVPLSDTTVVDYNDNYETSSNIHDSEAVQLGEGEMDSEKMDLTEIKNEESGENSSKRNNCQTENSGLSEKYKESDVTSVVEISNVDEAEYQKRNVENTSQTAEGYTTLIEYDVSFEEYQTRVQEQYEHIISFVTNYSFKSNNINQKEKKLGQEIKSDVTEGELKFDEGKRFDGSKTIANIFEAEIVESLHEETEPENFQTCETTDQSVEVSEVIEAANNVEESIAQDAVESVVDVNVVEIYETPRTAKIVTEWKTSQLSELINTDTNETDKSFEKIKNIDKIDDSTASYSLYSPNAVIVANAIVQDEDQNNDDVVQAVGPEKKVDEPEPIDNNEKNSENNLSDESSAPQGVQFYTEESITTNTDAIEQDDSDLDTEHLEYQLEDDVFISEELPHEIILTDPLEGVGLIEEIDKTSDSFDIPLEPVSASDEIVESPQLFSTEKLEDDKVEQIVSDHNGNPLTKIDDDKFKKIIPCVATKGKNIFIPGTDLMESADKLNRDTTDDMISLTESNNKNKEMTVKLSKPDVQILSPTSTNTEDYIATSKDNVYLEPRRKLNSENDVSESNSVVLTTKAAKKLYECDLQIPAVTTSGDVSTKMSKKSVKYRHDTVSSSKRERALKESIRSKKYTLKRSKRINEKNQIKNEQKEMLRLLAEKRRQKKESKQRKTTKQKEEGDKTEENIDKQDNLNGPSETKEIEEVKSKNSNEHDDEYVEFKQLLEARKLKKLKKMQEVKHREAKETKGRTEDVNKNAAKDVQNSIKNKKLVKEDKPAVVSSSRVQENTKAETQRECCIGCNNSTKKPNVIKDDKLKIRRRKSCSDSKITKMVNHETDKTTKTEFRNSASEVAEAKTNTFIASPDEITAVVKTKPDVDNDKSNTETDSLMELKATEKVTKTEGVNTEEKIATPVPCLEELKGQNCVAKKVKVQKRVSFCDEICSSTSLNESYGLPASEDVSKQPLNIKTYSTSTPKDPRRRSKSYAGQVMVPSVSELIEENNGAVCKKKISLADYVSRKRKTSSENSSKTKPEEAICVAKKPKFENSAYDRKELVETAPTSYKSEESNKITKKTIRDVKTSFVIHSSDWEDSQSPIPTTIQSNDECLIRDFSGLIKSKTKKPVIDVNELSPLETLENPKDKKLQEYKDKVDSQLSSLTIQIPKIKSQTSEIRSANCNLVPFGSPESSSLIKKFLSSEKITQSEMEKIKKIISYKRFMQCQHNPRSPSKSPGSSSSTYSQSPAFDSTFFAGKSPASSESAYSEGPPDLSYEIKNRMRSELDSREMRLHLKKVNAKRKLHLEYDGVGSSSAYSNHSENRREQNVDYSVINRLGKDGLPKIIFKRNRHSNISDDSQLVVELERIDDDLEKIEEKYNVTVTQMM